MPTADVTTSKSSTWAPLRNRIFLALWAAALVSNLGTFMQNVGAQWLMTELTASATAVALLQTAAAVPVFALSLHAGALADVVDRRRLLIFAQSWMLLSAAALAVVDSNGNATPAILLALTASLAIGSALNAPAWSAIVPEIVTREQLPAALVINGMTFTAAMAVGPALGGLVIAAAGTAAVFAINALSFLATIVVLWFWKREQADDSLPPEHLQSAVRSGVRYLRHAPTLWPVLTRVGLHVLMMSATMSLLPILARSDLNATAGQFGVLLGAMGIGAALGAFIVPRVRERWGIDTMVAAAALIMGLGTVLLSQVDALWLAVAVLAANGLTTMAVMSSFNLAVQRVLPEWVRGRGLAIYLLVFQAAIALGALGWGVMAQRSSVRSALFVAGVGMCVTAVIPVFVKALQLASSAGADSVTGRWPAPAIEVEPAPEDGPVMVTVEYHIPRDDADAFIEAMGHLAHIRRRDGALHWNVYRDLSDPRRIVESYTCQSWAEHMRLRSRSTTADADVWRAARAFHDGPEPPVARFHVAGHVGQQFEPVTMAPDAGPGI